ncbi:MAG: flagellar hook-length control protein FliK [Lachnospiraceae bacterium]|nr:flagellar hook-length control protein FliK [Lachnospiraceae bacterium]
MSGAPVKGIGSLLTIVNAPNAKPVQSVKDTSAMSFGDAMTKAQNSNSQKDTGKADAKLSKPDETKVDNTKVSKKTTVEDKAPVKENTRAGEVKDAAQSKDEGAKDLTPEQIEQVEGAAIEVVNEIAEVLEISPEELLDVMEDMDINPVSVFDSQVIQDLVLEVKADGEPMALITNEELFNTVKDLNAIADAAIADLAEDMDIEFSDVVELVEQVEVQLSNTPEMQMSVKADSEPDTVKETPNITVTVNRQDQDITFETDEKGNVIKTEQVTRRPVEDTQRSDRQNSEGEQKNGDENHLNESQIRTQGLLGNGNQMPQGILNTPEEVPQNAEVPQNSFFSAQTQDIMNQIMDNMRINLKPEMDELEMQLHPESLGMVKVNLTNKAGEITAEFKVMNETVKAAMETQLVQLRETLRDNGVRVEAVEVSVDTGAFDSNLYQGQGQNTEYEEQEAQRKPRRINLNDLNALFEEEATEEEILAAEMMEANGNTVDFQA